MQLRTSPSIKFFDEMFRRKFNFEPYQSADKPTVFFGLYRPRDLQAVINHRGIKIIWLAGSDAMAEGMLLEIKNNPALQGATVIAESRWIREDLDKYGIKYETISFCLDNLYAWKPVPLGSALYWYGGTTTKFGRQYLPLVKQAFPDLEIITNDSHTAPHEEMPKIYARCFAGVRPIEHDGMSQGVAEMGLMGRYTIWNMKTPFTVGYNNIDGIINAIRHLQSDYNYKLVARRARSFFIHNEIKWADLVLRLCGTDELDVTGIFHEDPKRCGSIFRIQRRADIEQIGGLGEKQFERGWYRDKMAILGKKSLITSKHSGFIVSEFKNIDKNKGYPQGVDYNTHDRTTS